jgi:hypothetical protein
VAVVAVVKVAVELVVVTGRMRRGEVGLVQVVRVQAVVD